MHYSINGKFINEENFTTISKKRIEGFNDTSGSAPSLDVSSYVGKQGPPGDMGPIGQVGPQGPIGNVGDNGPVGPAGPMGPTGIPGPNGTNGKIGNIGPSGVQGPRGNPGVTGVQGITGPMGSSFDAGFIQTEICNFYKSLQSGFSSQGVSLNSNPVYCANPTGYVPPPSSFITPPIKEVSNNYSTQSTTQSLPILQSTQEQTFSESSYIPSGFSFNNSSSASF